MDQTRKDVNLQKAALDAEFEGEINRLTSAARRSNSVEAVMRLRALADISGWLDTDRLLALAVWVSEQNLRANPAKLAS